MREDGRDVAFGVVLAGHSPRDAEFTDFMSQHAGTLRYTGWLLAGDQADSLVQRALVRAYGAWSRARTNPLAYTRRVLVNLSDDSSRQRTTAPRAVADTSADAGDRLLQALAQLTPYERRVVVLRYLVNVPAADVAADLVVGVSSVTSTASRGLAILRAALSDGLDLPTGDASDDQWADALREFARAAYPTGSRQPEPTLVVRAGRRRRTTRRTAWTTAACAVAVTLAFGVPPLLDGAKQPISALGLETPTATAPRPRTPSPTPSSPYPGLVTVLPTELTDSVDVGLFGTPAIGPKVGGSAASIIGPGDGTVLPVEVTPHPQNDSQYSYRSGLGLWTPGGSVDWMVAPPSPPELGPTTTEAAVSADWVAWFEVDSATPAETPYVLWARPRAGGTAHELARSPQYPDGTEPYQMQLHDPVILGDSVFWHDEAYQGGRVGLVVMSAPLDGSRPATVLVHNAWTLVPDRCSDDPALFVATFASWWSPVKMHRIEVGADGAVVADRTVDGNFGSLGEDVQWVTACGDMVAVAHLNERKRADWGSWLEIRRAGVTTRSIAWPSDTGLGGFSILEPGPGFVSFFAGDSETWGTYMYDFNDQAVHPMYQAFFTDGTFAWWYQPVPGSDTEHLVAARIIGR